MHLHNIKVKMLPIIQTFQLEFDCQDGLNYTGKSLQQSLYCFYKSLISVSYRMLMYVCVWMLWSCILLMENQFRIRIISNTMAWGGSQLACFSTAFMWCCILKQNWSRQRFWLCKDTLRKVDFITDCVLQSQRFSINRSIDLQTHKLNYKWFMTDLQWQTFSS